MAYQDVLHPRCDSKVNQAARKRRWTLRSGAALDAERHFTLSGSPAFGVPQIIFLLRPACMAGKRTLSSKFHTPESADESMNFIAFALAGFHRELMVQGRFINIDVFQRQPARFEQTVFSKIITLALV